MLITSFFFLHVLQLHLSLSHHSCSEAVIFSLLAVDIACLKLTEVCRASCQIGMITIESVLFFNSVKIEKKIMVQSQPGPSASLRTQREIKPPD